MGPIDVRPQNGHSKVNGNGRAIKPKRQPEPLFSDGQAAPIVIRCYEKREDATKDERPHLDKHWASLAQAAAAGDARGMEAYLERIQGSEPERCREIRASLDAAKAAAPPPAIEITTKRHEVALHAVNALARDPDIYCRGGSLVTVVREDSDTSRLTARTTLSSVAGSPKVLTLSDAAVGCALTRNAEFFAWKKSKGGEDIAIDAHPPEWLIRAVATQQHWPEIRRLDAVAEAPYLRPDGSLVEKPGYDAATRTLYLPTAEFPPIPSNPNQDDAKAAWERLKGPIEQFPFESEDDRAVWLASLLTMINRQGISGPVPGVATIGNKASSGKGLSTDVAANIAYGRNAPTSSYPADPVEAAKVKVAIAISGKPLVVFDNIDEGSTYGNSALDSALTAESIDDRILGSSRMTGELPLRICWALNGNNISPGKDAHRRWLVCNLVSKLERPEERRDIAIDDLRAYVRERRGQYVRDALTILRAHTLAGRPRGDWAPLGSFEAWDRMIRGAVHFATGRDCCATRRKLADESPARLAKIGILEGWQELPNGGDGGKGITAAQAAELLASEPTKYETLRNALMHFGRDGKPLTGRMIGTILRGLRQSLIAGMMVTEAGTSHSAVLWTVSGSKTVTPDLQNTGECGESRECASTRFAGDFPTDNYMMAHGDNRTAHRNGGGEHSPDSPHSPDRGHA